MKHILTIAALSFVVCAHAQSVTDATRGTVSLTQEQGSCPKGRLVAVAANGDKGCWRTIKKGHSIKWTKGEKPTHYEAGK